MKNTSHRTSTSMQIERVVSSKRSTIGSMRDEEWDGNDERLRRTRVKAVSHAIAVKAVKSGKPFIE